MANYVNYNHEFRRNRFSEPTQMLDAFNIFTPHATQKHMLGCILDLNDGRRFRYCENGGTALTKALMNQQAVVTTNWQNQVQTNGTAAAIGDTSIVVAVSTAPVAGDWNDGYLIVQHGTGQDEMYIIKKHTLTTTPRVEIADSGGIRIATAVTSDITIVKNLWKDVIVHPVTTATGMAIGVAPVTVAANYFFWAQTRGPCPMQVDTGDTLVIGEFCGLPGTSAIPGAVGPPLNSDTTKLDGNVWGKVMEIGAAGETALVYLTIE